MKNSKLHSLGFLAAAALILASCGTSNKVAKNGFGGSFGEGEIARSSKKTSVETRSEPQVVTGDKSKTEITYTASGTVAKPEVANVESSKTTVADSKHGKKSLGQKVVMAKEVKKAIKRGHVMVKSTEPKDDVVILILEVILCFIIPPLAYYIHKRTADTWFWVDLILFIIAISWFFGVGWGLAGLASVVIALLAVFDVI